MAFSRGAVIGRIGKNYDTSLIIGQTFGKLDEGFANCPEMGSFP